MTKREAAIIGAYTGILVGSFTNMHEYVNEIMGRNVQVLEMAFDKIAEEIKQAATKDFMTLVIEDDDLGAKIMNEISRIKTEIGSLITQYTELKAEHARLCKRREEND